jgi:hypothetical protein
MGRTTPRKLQENIDIPLEDIANRDWIRLPKAKVMGRSQSGDWKQILDDVRIRGGLFEPLNVKERHAVRLPVARLTCPKLAMSVRHILVISNAS